MAQGRSGLCWQRVEPPLTFPRRGQRQQPRPWGWEGAGSAPRALGHPGGLHTAGSCCHILQSPGGGGSPCTPPDGAGWAPVVRGSGWDRQDPQRAKVWAGKGAALPDESAQRERGFLGLRWGLGLFFLQREES